MFRLGWSRGKRHCRCDQPSLEDTETALGRFLGVKKISLINDLVANAYGIEVMTRYDFTVLNKGGRVVGSRALLSAGTGLGAAVMFWNGKRYFASPRREDTLSSARGITWNWVSSGIFSNVTDM